MARIPTSVALEERAPSAGPGQAVYDKADRANLTAPGRALQSFGETVSRTGNQVAAAWKDSSKEADDYEVTKELIQFQREAERILDDDKYNMQPGGDGFSDGFRAKYDELARSRIKSFQDRGFSKASQLRLDQKYLEWGERFHSKANHYENVEKERFHVEELRGQVSDFEAEVQNNPDRVGEVIAKSRQLFGAARIPFSQRDKMLRLLPGQLEEIAVRSRVERGEKLEEVLKDIQRRPRGSDGKPISPLTENSQRGPYSSGRREIDSVLKAAAEHAGIDEGMLHTFSRIESGNDPRQRTGSYKGLFQLSESEFRKYGGKGDIYDPAENARVAAVKLKFEMAEFEKAHGRPATALDIYMVHQQGAGGYAAHMRNPDVPAWRNMHSTGEGRSKGAAWSKKAIWGNIPDDMKQQFGSVDNVTSADFVSMWAGKISRHQQMAMRAGGGSTDRGQVTAEGTRIVDPRKEGYIPGGDDTAQATDGDGLKNEPLPGDESMNPDDPAMDEGDPTFEADDAKYRHLSYKQRSTLVNITKVALREKVNKEVDNSLALMRSGKDIPMNEDGESAFDRAQRVMTPNQFTKIKEKIEEAKLEAKVLLPLARMNNEDAMLHVAGNLPDAVEGTDTFARNEKILKKADIKLARIAKARKSDMAMTLEREPEILAAREKIRQGRDAGSMTPQDAQITLIEARLKLQEEMRIPVYDQRILTKADATRLLEMPDVRTLTDSDIDKRLQSAAARAQKTYGPLYWKQAFTEAVSLRMQGDKYKPMMEGALRRMARSELINADDVVRMEQQSIVNDITIGDDMPAFPVIDSSRPTISPAGSMALPSELDQFVRKFDPPRGGLFGGGKTEDQKWAESYKPPMGRDSARPKPTQRQIDWLMQNPATRQRVFDQEFGAGAANEAFKALNDAAGAKGEKVSSNAE